jgi:hypothetical protein
MTPKGNSVLWSGSFERKKGQSKIQRPERIPIMLELVDVVTSAPWATASFSVLMLPVAAAHGMAREGPGSMSAR